MRKVDPSRTSCRWIWPALLLCSIAQPLQALFTAIYLPPGRHLFLDDKLVDPALTDKVSRQMTPPTQIRRVLKPEMPWEGLGFIFYSTALDHNGTAMLYYGCYDGDKGKHLALAMSQDGLTWKRPNLGLTKFQGNPDNNLFPMEAVEAGVFIDPNAPPEKRFRLLHNKHWPSPEQGGVYLSNSPDGIHWKPHPTRLLPMVPDSQPSAFWDPTTSKYNIFLRAWAPKRSIGRVETCDIESPWPFNQTASPYHVWGKHRVPTIGYELPVVMSPDDNDPPNVHLYTSTVFRYPWAKDAYLAFPAAYFHFTGDKLRPRALDGNDGTFDIQLATSSDGKTWERFREPWVEPGHIGGLTLQLTSMCTGMIRRGRELHQYFVGWPHTHNRPVEWDRNLQDREASKKQDLGGIYCATSRLDGFVAMVAGNPPGTLTTRPLLLPGSRLTLNIDTSGTGSATVAILDDAAKPLPGYSHENCEVIHTDDTHFEVKWNPPPSRPIPQKQPVRIQIQMRNTKLWAIGTSE